MNHTATVKMILVLFMLCSGFLRFPVASNRLRFLHVPDTNNSDFQTSLKKCNGKDKSLATVYDEEDANFINEFLISELDPDYTWLGLQKSGQNVTTWSDGVPITFNISRVTVTNGEQICEAVENNTWKGFNCSDKKPFMCYKDNDYTLIEKETKNWCQAQQYCRKHFTDLVSIRNETQNQEVIDRGRDKSFWIGLQHDEWKWTDKSCSTYRNWKSINSEHCVVLGIPASLRQRECESPEKTLCSKGFVRIIAIKKNLTWEQAFDYCEANHTSLLQIQDDEDQRAVEQFFRYTNVTDDYYWIGLRQSRVFGFWIWRDSTVTYSNWKNDKQPEMPLSNNCGVISRSDNRWSDENCWLQLPFLCEEQISFMK